MIPTNKLKKLVLHCITKFIDSATTQTIWDNCSNEILQTTENRLNPLEIKEIFYKELLPDLSYNNFGYDNEVVEKLKRLKTVIENDGTSSINWMEVDKDLDVPTVEESMTCLHSDNLDDPTEEQSMTTDSEYDGDDSINGIFVKYDIPGKIRAVQDPFISEESEQVFSFRESQLLNVFGTAGNDPLANHSTEELFIEQRSFIANHWLKRKYNSLTNINLTSEYDQDTSENSSPKKRRSNSFNSIQFSSLCETGTFVELNLEPIVQRLEDDTLDSNQNEIVENSVPKESGNKSENVDNPCKETEFNGTAKSTEEIVAEIQKKINDAFKNGEDILQILDQYEEYVSMLDIPSDIPDTALAEPESRHEEQNDSEKSIKESQNAETIQQPKVKPTRTKFVRALQIHGPKLTYESSQGSDPTNQEETLNLMLMNDTVLSGSHKDCIGEVKEITLVSQSLSTSRGSQSRSLNSSSISKSQNRSGTIHQSPKKKELKLPENEEETIKRIQALLDAAESHEEIDRILDENLDYCCYLVIPFRMPNVEKPGKSKEQIIEEVQRQLDAARDFDKINKILDENEEYLEYLTIPFFEPPTLQAVQQTEPKKMKSQDTQNQAPQANKTENKLQEFDNIERSASRTELSFLLVQNVNLTKRDNVVSQPRKLDENLVIDLIDDDD